MGLSCPHCTKEITGWIPEDRLSKATSDKREALAKVEEQLKQIEALNATASTAEGLQGQLEAATAALSTATTNHGRQVDVMRHGITDSDDIADLLAIFERRETNGTTVGEWLGNRDALPRSVSALLGGAPTPAATPTTEPPPPVEAAPPPPASTPVATSANAGAIPVPPGGTALPSPAEIGQMSTEQYRQHRDRLLASLTSKGPTV